MLFGYMFILSGHFVIGRSHREVVSGWQNVVADKDRQIKDLQQAREREIARAEAATEAARSARDLLLGLQQASHHRLSL